MAKNVNYRRLRSDGGLSGDEDAVSDVGESTCPANFYDLFREFAGRSKYASAKQLHVTLDHNLIFISSEAADDRLVANLEGRDWAVGTVCEILLLYLLGTPALKHFPPSEIESVMLLYEISEDFCLPPETILALGEWFVEKYVEAKENVLNCTQAPEEDVGYVQKLRKFSSELMTRSMMICEEKAHKGRPEDVRFMVRYLFARGKLIKALGKLDEAKEYLTECLLILDGLDTGIQLGHLNQDDTITASRVRFILESVDFQAEICRVRTLPHGLQEARQELQALAEKLLSGDQKESFMSSVDPQGWSNMLKELSEASLQEDVHISLRCQLRLLDANLPVLDSATIADALENPLKFLEPLFSTTFMNFMMNSVQLEKIIFSNFEGISFDRYEMDLLSRVEVRLLLISHCCHQTLCTENADASTQKLRVLLSYAMSFFIGLLQLNWDPRKDEEFVSNFELVLEELGSFGCLLFRKAMFSYFAIPVLCQLYYRSKGSEMVCEDSLKLLEHQIQHMLKFCFDVSFDATDDVKNISYVPPLEFRLTRKVNSLEELLVIWQMCTDWFSPLSRQMLKRRAGIFIDQCYNVAVRSLPDHVVSGMMCAIEKCGVDRPGINSMEQQMPFPSFDSVDSFDPRHYMDPSARDAMLRLFSSIFYFKVQAMNPIDPQALKRQDGIKILKKTDKAYEERIRPYLWDIAFNPGRTDQWQYLAEFYHGMAEWIESVCMEQGQQPSREQTIRLQRHRNIGFWCSFIAIKCVEEEYKRDGVLKSRQDKFSLIYEFNGLCWMENKANAPPEFDQWNRCPDAQQTMESHRNALAAFIGASRLHPRKWSTYLLLGRCLKTLEYLPSIYMPAFACACQLAQQEFGGLVDPVYDMHASRIDLMTKIWNPCTRTLNYDNNESERREIYRICSAFCFSESLFLEDTGDETLIAQSLYLDAKEALEWCLEMDSHYYKANLKLAEVHESDLHQKFLYLNRLFSKGKQEFSLNMWPILEKGPHIQRSKGKKRKRSNKDGPVEGLMLKSQAEAGSLILDGTTFSEILVEFNASKPKVKTVGIGLNEDANYRIFKGKVRSAVLNYLILLKDLDKIDLIQSAILYLRELDQDRFTVAEIEDILFLFRACKLLKSVQNAVAFFPTSEIALLNDAKELLIDFNPPRVIVQSNLPRMKQMEYLKLFYDVYIHYLKTSQEDWASSIVEPVGRYLRWRIKENDHTDSPCGKLLITSKGMDVLGIYGCLFARLASESPLDAVTYYTSFLESHKDSSPNRESLLALVLCANCTWFLSVLVKRCLIRGDPTLPVPGDQMETIAADLNVSETSSFVKLMSMHVKDIMDASFPDDLRQQLGLYIQEHVAPNVDLLMQKMHDEKINQAAEQEENSQRYFVDDGIARTRPEMLTSHNQECGGLDEANIASGQRCLLTTQPIHEHQDQMTLMNDQHLSMLPHDRGSLAGNLPRLGGYASSGQQMHTQEVPPQGVQGSNDLGIAALAIQRLMEAMYNESN